MYHKDKERQQRKRGKKRWEKQFSIQSWSTLRDDLIYCQIGWMIINNLSQALQSTRSAITVQTEPWARSRSRDINIKENETEERVCLFCVCMWLNYSQAEGVFLPRELGGGFNFPLEQISIYILIPLCDFILLSLLIEFRAAVIKDWPLSVFLSFLFHHWQDTPPYTETVPVTKQFYEEGWKLCI